jgi:hypothetical protein
VAHGNAVILYFRSGYLLNRLVIQILRVSRLGEEKPAFGDKSQVLNDKGDEKQLVLVTV